MTDREQTRRDAHEQLREMIGLYVPAGFRDDDGVWNAGPHRARALHYLDALLTELEQAERDFKILLDFARPVDIQAAQIQGGMRHDRP